MKISVLLPIAAGIALIPLVAQGLPDVPATTSLEATVKPTSISTEPGLASREPRVARTECRLPLTSVAPDGCNPASWSQPSRHDMTAARRLQLRRSALLKARVQQHKKAEARRAALHRQAVQQAERRAAQNRHAAAHRQAYLLRLKARRTHAAAIKVRTRHAASRSYGARSSYSGGNPRAYARGLVGSTQFNCLNSLWNKESGWRASAANSSSGAYGIPQALPGYKMASAGSDWRTNPRTQIRWGIGYIKGRYGSPCAAWAHSQSQGWY